MSGAEKLLVEGSTIDERWIKGIRAGWKQLVGQTKKYPGRVNKHERDLDFAREMAEAAAAALRNMQSYLKRLESDLLISKGFWTIPSAGGSKEINLAKRWKSKVIEELDKAQEAVSEGSRRVQHWVDAYLTPPQSNHPWLGAYHREIASQEGFDTILRTLNGTVDEAVDAADAAISKRLLRHLSSLVSTAPVGPSGKKTPIDFGGAEPEVLHVGSFTVVFQDTPEFLPSKIGTETTTVRGRVVKMKPSGKPTGKGEVFRSPTYRQHYARYIKDAHSMLAAKGLGFLAKGVRIVVRPEGKAPDNMYNAALGVGGHYSRQSDTVTIFSDPSKDTSELLVHELGHRYWYKYMSAQDRENFGRWFGQVPAVSSYGGRHRREDFAEAFSHYVTGKRMTRDQIQRFRQFMTGKRPKLEALEEGATSPQKCRYCETPAVRSLILADGDFIPVCSGHGEEARRRVRMGGGSIVDARVISPESGAYREHVPMLRARMRSALEPALAYVPDENPGTHFGLQAGSDRLRSALSEAPRSGPVPVAPIGRADIPRGVLFPTRTGKDITGFKGVIHKHTGPDPRYQTGDSPEYVKGRAIPDSLLKMLGTDWKTMRAHRVHDNRMTITIDGVRYSVYTRRG